MVSESSRGGTSQRAARSAGTVSFAGSGGTRANFAQALRHGPWVHGTGPAVVGAPVQVRTSTVGFEHFGAGAPGPACGGVPVQVAQAQAPPQALPAPKLAIKGSDHEPVLCARRTCQHCRGDNANPWPPALLPTGAPQTVTSLKSGAT